MFSIQANATKSIATNAALPRLRNHLWSIPSAPPLLRQFTNIWNIPHLKNGLRIIYYLLLSHFSIGIILNVIVLKVPLLMPVWWVCALQLLKRKPQENPRSYLAFQEAAKRAEPICFRICCSKMARWDPALVRLKSSHRSWPMLKSTAKMELSVGIGLSLQLGRPC